MNLALLLKQPLLKKYLLNQLAYYADGWYIFESNEKKNSLIQSELQEQYHLTATNSTKANIVIVAKTHYRETWQSYTSISKKELQQILALQKSSENSTTLFQVINNNAIDGYDIKKITFDPQLLDELGEQKLLIPETELFDGQHKQQENLGNSQVWLLSLETPLGILFSSYFVNKSASSYAKGLISTLDAFKLSSGLPAEIEPIHISKCSYGGFLLSCLAQQRFDQLYRKILFNAKTWFKATDLHLFYWTPLLTACAFYLFTNSYLWLKNYNVEREFSEQSNEITQLLKSKYHQEQQKRLLDSLDNEFLKTTTVHEHWAVIYQLIESGMVIERLNFSKNLLTIRGQSSNASKVLTQIAKNPRVNSASFKGPVLKSRGTETFTLELIPVSRAAMVNIENHEKIKP